MAQEIGILCESGIQIAAFDIQIFHGWKRVRKQYILCSDKWGKQICIFMTFEYV